MLQHVVAKTRPLYGSDLGGRRRVTLPYARVLLNVVYVHANIVVVSRCCA